DETALSYRSAYGERVLKKRYTLYIKCGSSSTRLNRPAIRPNMGSTFSKRRLCGWTLTDWNGRHGLPMNLGSLLSSGSVTRSGRRRLRIAMTQSASSRRAGLARKSGLRTSPQTIAVTEFDRLADLPVDHPDGDLTPYLDEASAHRPGRKV